jgi:hypothetical protein
MDKSSLEKKKLVIEEKFSELTQQIDSLIIERHNINGGYRLLNELIEEITSATEEPTTEPSNSNKRTGK